MKRFLSPTVRSKTPLHNKNHDPSLPVERRQSLSIASIRVQEMKQIETHIKPELGKVSRFIEVPELIVRTVPSYGLTPELDGGMLDDNDDEIAESGPKYEDRLQGRLVNATKHRLSDIKYDLSYFDSTGAFLGLNKSRFLEEDELDVDDHLPIDMKVELPDGTAKCVFNVRAKKPGLVGRMFWG